MSMYNPNLPRPTPTQKSPAPAANARLSRKEMTPSDLAFLLPKDDSRPNTANTANNSTSPHTGKHGKPALEIQVPSPSAFQPTARSPKSVHQPFGDNFYGHLQSPSFFLGSPFHPTHHGQPSSASPFNHLGKGTDALLSPIHFTNLITPTDQHFGGHSFHHGDAQKTPRSAFNFDDDDDEGWNKYFNFDPKDAVQNLSDNENTEGHIPADTANEYTTTSKHAPHSPQSRLSISNPHPALFAGSNNSRVLSPARSDGHNISPKSRHVRIAPNAQITTTACWSLFLPFYNFNRCTNCKMKRKSSPCAISLTSDSVLNTEGYQCSRCVKDGDCETCFFNVGENRTEQRMNWTNLPDIIVETNGVRNKNEPNLFLKVLKPCHACWSANKECHINTNQQLTFYNCANCPPGDCSFIHTKVLRMNATNKMWWRPQTGGNVQLDVLDTETALEHEKLGNSERKQRMKRKAVDQNGRGELSMSTVNGEHHYANSSPNGHQLSQPVGGYPHQDQILGAHGYNNNHVHYTGQAAGPMANGEMAFPGGASGHGAQPHFVPTNHLDFNMPIQGENPSFNGQFVDTSGHPWFSQQGFNGPLGGQHHNPGLHHAPYGNPHSELAGYNPNVFTTYASLGRARNGRSKEGNGQQGEHRNWKKHIWTAGARGKELLAAL